MLPKLKHQALMTFAVIAFIFLPAVASFAETLKYVYDNLSRLKSIEYGNGTMIVYLYDEVGNRISATSESDSDVDGMPDAWEATYGLNSNFPNDAGYDKDGDGLTNLQEYQSGTVPTNPDTDGDGMSDRWEVLNNLDPLVNDALGDNDNDGLTNLTEYQYGANPAYSDTDGDQMPDEWEIAMGLNPYLNDAAFDNDGDGSNNLQEYQAGTHPMAKIALVDNSSADMGIYNSIDVDTNNNAHISYYDSINTSLKYASKVNGIWTPFVVASTDNVGKFSSIAVDSNNNVHISYYKAGTIDNLMYVSKINGSWVSPVTVESTDDVGQYSSIAVDSNNNVHISYYKATSTRLKYISKINGSWNSAEVVDATGSAGTYTSIAVDSNNNIHISYYDATNTSLKYASKVNGAWSPLKTVDSTGNVGAYSSIAVDSSDNVHISYYDATAANLDLKYVSKVNGVWGVPEVVDSTGDVGKYTSIAVDANNKVHISYYDVTNANLKYATNVSGSWVTAIVASSVSAGYTSIAVDSRNKVHISYYDGSLRYATSLINSITANPGGTYSTVEGQAITLNATTSTGTIVKYEWDVNNDGIYEYSSSSSPTQSHTYAQQGTYTIRLRVTDSLGITDNATTTATVSDSTPTANFTASPTSGPAPLTVNFFNSSTGYDQPLSYAWDFDNNGTVDSTALNPSAIYTGPGTYTVKLTVTDSNGDPNTLTNSNYISVALPGYTLTINKTGNGTVTSLPIGIDCGSDCAETYSMSTAVTLTALPNAGSRFTGWSGGGCSGTGDCTVTMDTNKTITATFNTCSNLPVRIMRGTTIISSYSSLQIAYNNAIAGDVVQSQAALFTENLNASDINNKSITIEGGYDCGYTSVTGKTVLKGQATISKGSNRVKNFVFKK
jgi:PKD repeat protein